MKKSYFLMAAAAAMFAACSETDMVNAVNEAQVQNAIGFEEFVGKSTRGINTTNLINYHAGFGVWAYKGDAGNVTTAVMENYNVVGVEVGGDVDWVYAGKTGGTSGSIVQVLKYWDKLKAYEFYAYAPYNEAVTLVDKKIQIVEGEYAANENLAGEVLKDVAPTTTYTGEGDPATNKTTDWMIATITPRGKGENDVVQVPFTHTMSRLIVNLKSTTDATLTINSVSVNNVIGTGKFQNGAWVVDADNKKNIPGAKGNMVGSSTTPATYYCMEYLVLPSTVQPSFSIDYTLNGDTKVVSNVPITNVTKFDAGTAYEVTVTIGNDPIVFNASVTAWDTPVTGGVTIN